MSTIFNQLAVAMRNAAIADITAERKIDAARPIGEKRIDIGFYDDVKDRNKPVISTRWSAILVKWNGKAWKRIKRLTGPSLYEDALNDVTRIARQRDLERV